MQYTNPNEGLILDNCAEDIEVLKLAVAVSLGNKNLRLFEANFKRSRAGRRVAKAIKHIVRRQLQSTTGVTDVGPQ